MSKYIDDIVEEFRTKAHSLLDIDNIETGDNLLSDTGLERFEAFLRKKIAETIKHTEELTIEKCAKVVTDSRKKYESQPRMGKPVEMAIRSHIRTCYDLAEAIRKIGE